MGIHIKGKLIVGLEYDKMVELLSLTQDEPEEYLDSLLDNGEIDYSSHYYDSPRNMWCVGEDVGRGGIDINYQFKLIQESTYTFKKKFGVYPLVYCCADVT